MADVEFSINGRDYKLHCNDGEEPRIRDMAGILDGKVKELSRALGQVGEARLLVAAAIVLLDEAMEPAEKGDSAADSAEEKALSALADKLEAVAARLETA